LSTLIFMALNIYSINVNGLRNYDKIKAVFGLLADWRCDYCLLQETFWDDDFVNEIKYLWDGDIFYSNNKDKHCGVAILVNKIWKQCSKLDYTDKEGRIVSIDIKNSEFEFKLTNVYAPNKISERCIFFDNLTNYLNDENNIVGGDFNTSLSDIDRCNTIHNKDSAYTKLDKLMTDCQLYDIWRKRNPGTRVFSWKRIINNQLKASRIDYFLMNQTIKSHVKHIFYKETTLSDHSFIYTKIDFSNIDRGEGVWVMNNTFLEEQKFHEKIVNLVTRAKEEHLYNSELLVWWDNLKYHVKKTAQIYGYQRNRKKYEKYNRLQRQFQNISESIAIGNIKDTRKYEELKQQLSELEYEQCQGAILRSKAIWATESDKNTRFFLNLEKSRQNNKSISELINEEGNTVRDTDSILHEQYKYYKELYSCVDVNEDDIDSFLQKINISVSVNEEDREMCDKDINKEEIHTALKSMSKNKSPGTDGLTVEFYMHFYELFEDIFYKLFKCIEEESVMSRSMRHGMITLIHKKNDKRLLKNWRPISLLNVDYKILARIMSNRIKTVLPKIISREQSACIMGRDISDTICSIRDIIHLVENEKMEGYLVKIDQQKAFDRVDHMFLLKCLDKYGFGKAFKNWIHIFYTDIYSTVKCNGYLTNYFPVKNSVRQGCPISALLFVLIAEPLNSTIKSNKDIHGIQIPNSEIESIIFQHADDTTLTVRNKKSIAAIFHTFDQYSRASGAKLNKDKTEIMSLGSGNLNNSDLEHLHIDESCDVLQILGVYLGKNESLCDELNWKPRLTKLKATLNLWKQRHVNIQGRAVIIASLLLSRIWYVLMVQPIPSDVSKEIKKACLEFLWLKKSYPVKFSTIIGDKTMGGLNIPDIDLKMKAFRLKFLKRSLDESFYSVWKHVFVYTLEKIIHIKKLSECLSMKLPKQRRNLLPPFYKEMFLAWEDLDCITECDIDCNQLFSQPIFDNPKICFKEKPLYFECFVKSGLTQIKHIAYEVVTGFLPMNAIKEIIWQTCPDVSEQLIEKAYMVIMHSIPLQWYNIVNKHVYNKHKDHPPLFVIVNRNKTYAIRSCSTSNFYCFLRDMKYEQPSSLLFWNDIFNLDETKVLNTIYTKGKCPDMIDLDFRIFHNIIYTYQRLYKMRLVDSELCPFCLLKTETLLHLFRECPRISTFIQFVVYHVENLMRNVSTSVVNCLDFDKMLLLGFSENIPNVNSIFVNLFLSQVRLSIYKSRALFIKSGRKIDIILFFKYSLEKYCNYILHHHQIKQNLRQFITNFVKHNTVMKYIEDEIKFDL